MQGKEDTPNAERKSVRLKTGKSFEFRLQEHNFCVLELPRGIGLRRIEEWVQPNAHLCFPEDCERSGLPSRNGPDGDLVNEISPVVASPHYNAYGKGLVLIARNKCIGAQNITSKKTSKHHDIVGWSYTVEVTVQCIVKGVVSAQKEEKQGFRLKVIRVVPSNTAGSLSLVEVSSRVMDIPRVFRRYMLDSGHPVMGGGIVDTESFRGEKLLLSVIRLDLTISCIGDVDSERSVSQHYVVEAEPIPKLAYVMEKEQKFSRERHGHRSCTDMHLKLPEEYAREAATFDGLEFYINQDVMIPRTGSLKIVENAIALYAAAVSSGATHRPPRILDLGTGSGCLLLSLMLRLEESTGTGVDCSSLALDVAQKNAQRLGAMHRCAFEKGTFDNPGTVGHFDIVVCNPPYHARGNRFKKLDAATVQFEPGGALFVSDDEADLIVHYRSAIKSIASISKQNPGPIVVVFEIFRSNADPVYNLLVKEGVRCISIGKDDRNCIRTIQGLLG